MSEEKLSSHKLDIEGAQRLSAGEETQKESYRPISEDIGLTHVTGETVKNSNMVRENGDHVLDGADEKMLGSDDKEALQLKNVEVKFITGSDQNQNGDAKIDIVNVEKTFTGMTKDELMKYANDPFWVKLRWVLFILFWGLWIAMLAGAIAIIVYAPKCAAPTPLVWWKEGPLITANFDDDAARMSEIKDLNAKGVVIELSAEKTYLVDTPEVENMIKKLVEDYKAVDVHIVLDLTANYVPRSDKLFKQAIAPNADGNILAAFITSDTVNNWKKVGGTESAWKQEGQKYFLSQFGDNIDLQMSSPDAQKRLVGVLNHLAGLGVKGFRLNNAKHFIVSSDLSDELPNTKHNGLTLNDYGFYFHSKTTYVDGLGALLRNFSRAVHNATGGDGFLTIHDDAANRAEAFVAGNSTLFAFDLPRFEFLNHHLMQPSTAETPKKIHSSFDVVTSTIDKQALWMQVSYSPDNFKALDATAYNMFMSLLPGVQVVSAKTLNYAGNKTELIKKLEDIRQSQVFQHGNFDYLLSYNDTAFAYTRIKSGMPGYFVALNPTDVDITANFTSEAIGSELSVLLLSDNFPKDNPPKGKFKAESVPLSKRSVAIFTFVPK